MTSDRSTPDGEAAEPAPEHDAPPADDALLADDALPADDPYAGAVWSRSDELAVRAETTLSSIAKGANPSQEAFLLANAYTDEATERLRAGIRSLLRRILRRH